MRGMPLFEWEPIGSSLRQRLGSLGYFTYVHRQCLLLYPLRQIRVSMISYDAGELHMVIAKGMPQSSCLHTFRRYLGLTDHIRLLDPADSYGCQVIAFPRQHCG